MRFEIKLTPGICPSNARSANVLILIIKKYVVEGLIVYIEYFLSDHGNDHRKVNDRNPDNLLVAQDETHTQRIESLLHVIRQFFPKGQLV